MNILLLGNGFDLWHNLPTSYACFLHTVNYLKDNSQIDFNTINDVFKQDELQLKEKQIKTCYEQYKSIYYKIKLDKEKINFLIEKASSNMWFNYFSQSLNRDIGWIDFEKEIARVINAIRLYIKKENKVNKNDSQIAITREISYILKNFDFFIEIHYEEKSHNRSSYRTSIQKEYILEEPFGSKNYMINSKKIAETLYESLNELSEMLDVYLECFVEKPLNTMQKSYYKWKKHTFDDVSVVITFNYTNTYEKLYSNKNVHHIHGTVDNKIVLGINPDDYDKVGTVDTTFICFKKYYQRMILRTDDSYRKFINSIKDYVLPIDNLNIIGHSLDITDQDIIKDLFKMTDNITIYYHNQSALEQYIKNLIEIYGKDDFDFLKSDKKLKFLSLENLF